MRTMAFLGFMLVGIAIAPVPAAAQVAGSPPAPDSSVVLDGTVITLHGNAVFKAGGNVFSVSDGARYHPDRKFLETTFLKSEAPLSTETVSCKGNRIVVTFPDGTVAEADQMCAGGTRYTCRKGELIQEVESPACL